MKHMHQYSSNLNLTKKLHRYLPVGLIMHKSRVGALKKPMALDFGSGIAKTTPSYFPYFLHPVSL